MSPAHPGNRTRQGDWGLEGDDFMGGSLSKQQALVDISVLYTDFGLFIVFLYEF